MILSGSRLLVEELTADIVEIAREQEVEPENVIESPHLMIKPEQMNSCFLWISKESSFLRWESTPGEDAVNAVKITTEDPNMTQTQLIKG